MRSPLESDLPAQRSRRAAWTAAAIAVLCAGAAHAQIPVELAQGRARRAVLDFARWNRLETGDPYASIWLYIASVRAHDPAARRALPHVVDAVRRPDPVIRYLRGQTDWEPMFDAALSTAPHLRIRETCEAALFHGENLLAAGRMRSAMSGFDLAGRPRCAAQQRLRALALSEYRKLYWTGQGGPATRPTQV